MKFIIKIFSLILLFFLISCGESSKRKMGIVNTPPDEFQVYKRKELSVPPNFDLRVPDSSDAKNEINNKEENLIFSDNEKKELSINDEILLMSVGENKVDNNIREVINDENKLKEIEKSTLDKILDFEPVYEPEEKENIINAEDEKKRLEALKSAMEEIETDLEDIENKNHEDNKKYEEPSLHSIATENDDRSRPKNDKKVKNDKNLNNEEESFLDSILDFDLFGSEDEEVEAKNQRNETFFSNEKEKNNNKKEDENFKQISIDDDEKKSQKNNEKESFLDSILDFDLFGSEDEEVEAKNQRDDTFFNKEKEKQEDAE